MRMTTSVTFLLLLAGGLMLGTSVLSSVRAEDASGDDEVPVRKVREQELTIRLLEGRAHQRDALVESLFALLKRYGKTLLAVRAETNAAAEVLKRRIEELHEDLEAERDRHGDDESDLRRQLAAEQERHTRNVMALHTELATANELYERNRIEAISSRQRLALAEDENRRLRAALAHAARLFGEIGPAAAPALDWLEEIPTQTDGDVLAEAARAARSRIEAK